MTTFSENQELDPKDEDQQKPVDSRNGYDDDSEGNEKYDDQFEDDEDDGEEYDGKEHAADEDEDEKDVDDEEEQDNGGVAG